MRAVCWLTCCLLVCCLLPASADAQISEDFTLILLPDTQNEAQYYPSVFSSQTNWIAANKTALNTKFVLGLGDIVNDGASDTQWQNADAAIRLLEGAGVPYALALGNHDYDGVKPSGRTSNTTGFNKWFGPSRYSAYSWYHGNEPGGSYPQGSNENFYTTFTANGMQYLVLVLEYVPRDAALSWAASVVQANQDKEVIVVTHTYMFWDSTRSDRCDTKNMPADNDGDEMWDKFVRKYQNIIMVVNGHITTGQAARRADVGDNGNLVNQMYSNYQTDSNGGNGWLRILKFQPSLNQIQVLTYSPYLYAYKSETKNQFTIYYHNPNLVTGRGRIEGKVRSSGCTPISGATVSTSAGSAVTDSNGNYSISAPAPSLVDVTVTASGWQSQTAAGVRVDDGYGSSTNFYLNAVPTSPPCTLSTVDRSVTICTPHYNDVVTSPVRVVAGTTDSRTVTTIKIFLDGLIVYSVPGNRLDASIAMTKGTRRLTVQAYDSLGPFKSTVYVNVQ